MASCQELKQTKEVPLGCLNSFVNNMKIYVELK